MARTKTSTREVKQLGQHIARERQRRGISLERLSAEMKISKGNLSDLENGKRDPRFSTLVAIAEGLGLKLSQLLKDY
jgi:transcriptional regulator with XRE-family HTH domain